MTALVTAGAVAKLWLATLGMVALQGTLLALLAIVVTRAIGRSRPAWQAAIWLVVVAKLSLPWGPAMPYSLSDLVALLAPHHAAAAAASGPPALQPLPPAPEAWPAIGWLVLALVWALIATTIVARALHSYVRTRAAARAATSPPAWARALLHELVASEARPAWTNDHRVTLAIGAADVAPHVVGLARPIIVIPPALLADEQLLRAALMHELAHVQRYDVLGRFAQVCAAATCWFMWPIVRTINRRLDVARESACDARALEAGTIARPTYARLLVRMAELRGTHALSLAMPHALDHRVAAVLGPPARARMGKLQGALLAAWIVVGLGGARAASAHERPTCMYTAQLAATLFQSYPEADLDGDGTLSRDEACALQAQLRTHADELTSRMDAETEAEFQTLLSEPLCCNCDPAEANCSPQGVDR